MSTFFATSVLKEDGYIVELVGASLGRPFSLTPATEQDTTAFRRARDASLLKTLPEYETL